VTKSKTHRVPSKVPTAMNPATKVPTIIYTMIERDWVSIMIPLLRHTNDNIVVDMAVSPGTRILIPMIVDTIVRPTPKIPAMT